jgi:hypothetical protein
VSHDAYVSVVATSRNDDHGGNMLRRMQIFVNAWIEQCRRHDLASELILVEWNPPAGRETLSKVLQWPADLGPCEVRIVTVPEAIHRRYRHWESLPLFQMIAKNVGIRRARAPFVLITNSISCSATSSPVPCVQGPEGASTGSTDPTRWTRSRSKPVSSSSSSTAGLTCFA